MGFFSRSKSRLDPGDEQALERYRYLLRTAPPDAIEQTHEEAFSRLTPEQRRMALEQLAEVSDPAERRQASDDPRDLARMATRAEIRRPGILERVFGPARSGPGSVGGGLGMGLGGVLAGSLLGSIAGSVLGSAIAHSFFDAHPFQGEGAADAAGLAGPEDAQNEADIADTYDAGFGDSGGGFEDI
jgi:hypothetical protein